MLQLDLDHLFCVSARGSGFTESTSKVKAACETAAALPDAAGAVQLCGLGGGAGSVSSPGAAADDAGAPAESVVLRVPDGVCLTHLFGAAALRRDASTKGSSNPKAAAEAATATRKGAPGEADSRRLLPSTATAATSSKTAAAVVIGVLPASKVVVANKERRARARAPGRPVVARARRRPAAGGARVFASEAVVVGPEPVSPKVSCFGAVLPERSSAAAPAPPAGTQGEEEEGSGCWASLGTALLGGLFADSIDREASGPDSKEATAPEPQRQRAAVMSSPPRPVAPPPPGLGDVKRLASRRWPETMARETV